MKVLIMDSSSVVHEHVSIIIAGVEEAEIVGQTYATDETIKGIDELRPDVVILGIPMPCGGGIKVLEQIKRKDSFPTVIILTNSPYPQYRKKCMEEGASFFLDKSTEFEKVSEILRGLIEQGHPLRLSSCDSPDSHDYGS